MMRLEVAPSDETRLLPSDGDEADRLWHIAADDVEEWRAEHGLPWRSACGQERPPSRAVKVPIAIAVDDCLICADVMGELDDTT